MLDSTQVMVFHCHANISKYVDTVTKHLIKSQWPKEPLDDLWPISVEVTCATLPKYHCVQRPLKYIKSCGYSDPFFQKPNVNNPTWPLTHFCRGCMCDSTQDHCVQVSWVNINVCGYSDQFCKTYHNCIHSTYGRTYYVRDEWSHTIKGNWVQKIFKKV